MKKYDVIVIGGGLLGCFVIRALMRYGVNAALFESREDLCTGVSRANTAIVYSGCDTRPGTFKTELCVRSSRGFGILCDELGVRYSRCGSLMVSFGPHGDASLLQKREQGDKNGVRDIRLLGKNEVLGLEPGLSHNVTLGLFVPDTGTVSPWELCIAAAENAVHNGAELYLDTEVTAISRATGGYVVEAGEEYFTRGIINCAGLKADAVHEMVAAPEVRIVPTAGDYLVLDTKAAGAINRIIFHEPEERGKGLTLVPTTDGNILVGPTEQELSEDGEYASSQAGTGFLRQLVSEVIPSLPMDHVIRNFSAMRPNPFSVGKSINDFCILSPEDRPGLISLIGIKTPGLTCAYELGIHVSSMMAEALCLEKSEGFDPYRNAPLRVSELAHAERTALIRKDRTYGKIVCRCREISEGEIVDAVRRYPGAVTVDGVKQRVGATSGRCQGSFCTQRIIEILARETGSAPEQIRKSGPGSYIFCEEYGGSESGV